jgi:hypothetical protein
MVHDRTEGAAQETVVMRMARASAPSLRTSGANIGNAEVFAGGG